MSSLPQAEIALGVGGQRETSDAASVGVMAQKSHQRLRIDFSAVVAVCPGWPVGWNAQL